MTLSEICKQVKVGDRIRITDKNGMSRWIVRVEKSDLSDSLWLCYDDGSGKYTPSVRELSLDTWEFVRVKKSKTMSTREYLNISGVEWGRLLSDYKPIITLTWEE